MPHFLGTRSNSRHISGSILGRSEPQVLEKLARKSVCYWRNSGYKNISSWKWRAVMIPPMVGPTWSRVAYSLGSDYVLAVVSEDLPRGLGRCMCYLVRSLCVVCHVLVPPSLLPLPVYHSIR